MKPVADTIVYYRDGSDPSANAAAQKIADEYLSGRTEPLPPVLDGVVVSDVQVVIVMGLDAAP